MQHAVSLIKQTRWAAGDFHLEDAQGERLYAKSWLELATSGSTDLGIIYIRKSKPGDPVTPVSCRTTPRRVSVTKMITYKPLDESQPSEANFLPDGSRTFGRLEDPANQSEDEKVRDQFYIHTDILAYRSTSPQDGAQRALVLKPSRIRLTLAKTTIRARMNHHQAIFQLRKTLNTWQNPSKRKHSP